MVRSMLLPLSPEQLQLTGTVATALCMCAAAQQGVRLFRARVVPLSRLGTTLCCTPILVCHVRFHLHTAFVLKAETPASAAVYISRRCTCHCCFLYLYK